jgi:hypothetical protein
LAQEVLRDFDTRFPRDAAGTFVIRPTQAAETYWYGVVNDLPSVVRLAPAGRFDTKRSNVENVELYAIWPFGLPGIGKPDLELGLDAFRRRAEKASEPYATAGARRRPAVGPAVPVASLDADVVPEPVPAARLGGVGRVQLHGPVLPVPPNHGVLLCLRRHRCLLFDRGGAFRPPHPALRYHPGPSWPGGRSTVNDQVLLPDDRGC